MNGLNCPICEKSPIFKDNLVFCVDCNIYLGETVESIAQTLDLPLIKSAFAKPIVYHRQSFTSGEKFWLGVSFLLVILAAILNLVL